MAPRSALANISYTVDSASEDEMGRDDLNAMPTPDSNAENKAPARKARGKAAQTGKQAPATSKIAKGRPAARRASGGSVLGVKKQNAGIAKKTGAKMGRKVLDERQGNMSETEEVDEFDGEEEEAQELAKPASKRGRPARGKKGEEEEVAPTAAPAKRGRKAAGAATAQKPAAKTKTAAKSKVSKRVVEPESEHDEEATIPETQPEPELEPDLMDVEESIEFDEVPETMPPPPRPTARRAQQQARSSRQPSAGHRRAGSASDTERDPALRRKVGDLTKKLEAMTTKYESLKEIATASKESNVELMRKRTDQVAKDQDAVIKALKQQLSEMQSRSSEISSLRRETARLEKENARLASEHKSVSAALASAQQENKTLSTKLAAARSSTAPMEPKAVPGSAVKARPTGVVLPGAAEAAKEAQLRQQKIDLYSDLTNLVIVGVKKGEEGEDVYDCLQTGRNGTLHFQLSIANSDESYDDTNFVYIPILNEQRDRELLDLLPEYLTDEIAFSRQHVGKFYSRILESMTKKIELED